MTDDATQPLGQGKLTVVMPCLNEADTIGTCVEKAMRAMRQSGIQGEVIIGDNGSTDGSQSIAESLGARIVNVPRRGYGAALMGGIESSQTEYVLMGDADDSYDFLELPKFFDQLRAGADLVQGCRLPRGGGHVMPGAMPFLHRWIGNPGLSWLVRRMFRIPIHDVYCGMRGFRRDLYDRLDLRSPGMEFATEMIIRTGLARAKMAQVPITLHPDGREQHGPHLRTFRDGWRTLKLFLVFSPKWTFMRPGYVLIGVAAMGYILALPQARPLGVALDVHTLLVASLAGLLGWQCILMATLAHQFAVREGLIDPNAEAKRGPRVWRLERGLPVGAIAMVAGLALIVVVILRWWRRDFGELDYPVTMRMVVPGVTLIAAGFQTIMATMLSGVLKMARSRRLSTTDRSVEESL
ncbi:MAG: glycosyltransferase family 2 protein [Planctomycetota bacterium]